MDEAEQGVVEVQARSLCTSISELTQIVEPGGAGSVNELTEEPWAEEGDLRM